jgi:hypothetical protein
VIRSTVADLMDSSAAPETSPMLVSIAVGDNEKKKSQAVEYLKIHGVVRITRVPGDL